MSRSKQLPNLDKLFKDDDEQDFTPLGGSNLAAIFGTPHKSTDASSSLKPLPQKKANNERNTPPSIPSNKTEVILANAVHAYKLQNGQYTLIGKLGIALTGNAATKTYLLILYRNKQEHISVVTLTSDFSYSVRENNYATYYDGNNDNWSILFESNEACIEFAREIGLSKYFLRQGKADEAVFYQDLTAPSKEKGANENDKIHVKYVIITSIAQPLKLNAPSIQETEVQITTDDNWEKSLLGGGKGLKRILVLPPSKQISLGPGFPKDRDIALEIEIINITPPKMKISSPKPHLPSGKASLISRMAKMGQSILPKMPTSTTTDSEDTEEEVHVKSPRRLRNIQPETLQKSHHQNSKASPIQESPETPLQTTNILVQRNVIPTTVASPHGTLVPTSAFAATWAPQQQYVSTADGQFYPIQQAMPQSMTAAVDPNMNVFLSETRTHNAEIRIGMSKIADNVQKLLDKFHVLEVQHAASPNNEKALETSLKLLVALNASKNETRGSVSVEAERHTFANESSEREKIKSLEDALGAMKNSLGETLNKLESIENEKKGLHREKSEMQASIQRLKGSLIDSRNELQKYLTEIKNTNDLVMQYQKDNATLEAKIISLDIERNILEKAVSSKEKITINEHDNAAEIKQIMNKTYQTLVGKFTENSYMTEHIKTTIASTIRAITLQVLKERKIDADSNASSGAEMKTSSPDPKLSVQDSRVAKITEEDNITLPDIIAEPSDIGMDMTSTTHDEPPPIPPMDLDVDGDWVP